jgi:hypothetical protein
MKDADGDDWGDSAPPVGVDAGTDCNDANIEVHPQTVWYRDLDGDGFGDPDKTIVSCEQPQEYVLDGTDCRDGNGPPAAATYPGAAPNDSLEACMEDLDGDDWGDDNPHQGVTPGTDCNDGDPLIFPGSGC